MLGNFLSSKPGGSDGIVRKLLKYDGVGIVDLLEQLFFFGFMAGNCPQAMQKRPY